jgi:hypothetical protein
MGDTMNGPALRPSRFAPVALGLVLGSSALAGDAPQSSVKDPSSPFFGRSCKLSQHLANPTGLPADCRCLDNRGATGGIDACKRPFDLAKSKVSLGAGPSFAGYHNAHIAGGFVDPASKQLIAAVYWDGTSSAKGLIVAYDMGTWARRFVSGDWNDGAPKTTGSGPSFGHLKDVRPGKDGKWYALSDRPQLLAIFRVDPATGNRAVVWSSKDEKAGQCASGDPKATGDAKIVQYTDEGFAVDADGSFLLGYANPARDGRGIVRISADGSKCSYVTASGARADGMTRGAGDEMRGFVQGFTLQGGAIYAFTTGEKKLWSVDPATGNRAVVASPPLGERWVAWDGKRNVLWTAGFQNSVTLGALDLATKKTTNVFADCGKVAPWLPLCAEGPIRINSLNYGGLIVDPASGRIFLGHDSVGLVEFEPETGNSMVRSL